MKILSNSYSTIKYDLFRIQTTMSFGAKLLKFVIIFTLTFVIMCITYCFCTIFIQKKSKNWKSEFKKILSESWPILLTIALAICLTRSDFFN